MHVDDDLLPQLLQILQCQQAAFPQVYLGLPLSNTKLNLQAFAPLIAKVDRRLSGWQSTLLNKAGRAVLINSILDGMVTHSWQLLPCHQAFWISWKASAGPSFGPENLKPKEPAA